MLLMSSMPTETTKEIQKTIDESLKEAQNISAHNWEDVLLKYAVRFSKFGLKVLLALVIFYFGRKLIQLLMKPIRKFLIKSSLSDSSTIFLAKLIDVLLTLLLILIILLGIGINASAVAAFIGSLGIVSGLALQGSLSNLAGGILLVCSRPFDVGHWIIETTHMYQGRVTEVGMFYTKLLTTDHQEIIIPNGMLANATIVNTSKSTDRRIELRYIIKYEVDFDRIKERILDLLATKDLLIPGDRRVLIEYMDGQGVHLLVLCWCMNENIIPLRFELHEDIFNLLHGEDVFVQYQMSTVSIPRHP